ncbi:MAG TPA: hypothetical protein VHS08_04040, partial [Candidatus Acidoferrales bacterium]|nr:hypothetical protein [Candidatus Acidoferrales bacterium]
MKILRNMPALGAPLLLLTFYVAALPAEPRPGGQIPRVGANTPPTAEQLQSLIARVIENQHRNDRAIEEYERVEHVFSRKDGDSSEIVSERTERLVPSGTGFIHMQTAQSTPPVTPETHRRQLQYAISALDLYLHPNERVRQDIAKFERRRRERADLVDTMVKAFRVSWAGRETRDSRTLAKLLLDPDPNFKPATRLAAAFQHVHAVLWVDESEAQAARLEIDITSDISFVGGIVAKVYRGGHFVMQQSELGSGVWLPTLYTYDVDGRKFLMGFNIHEKTEVTHYRHVGPPERSIEIIRSELNNLTAET